MSPSGTAQDDAVQKHRACDECRIRKLACTKEQDGCSRCRRENIPCHYSPQKPMGRPRKRPREEPGEKPLAAAPPAKTAMTEQPPDTEDPGMEFINTLLEVDFGLDLNQSFQPTEEAPTTTDVPTQLWDYTNFGEVNFDSQPAENAPIFTPVNIDPALFIAPAASTSPSMDQVPALSPANSNTSGSPESASPAVMSSSLLECDCMARLYSALNWMQKLPDEVEPAIRLARLAAKTAYEVVNCNKCGSQLLPTMQHKVGSPYMMMIFQNMMLLGTLIPSIVHAYARMLNIVDEETNRAIAERRKMTFKLNGLGGIWGHFDNIDDEKCGAKRNFAYREMEPAMWRLTVRALLKIDVYGMSGRCTAAGEMPLAADPFHLGLKDIVTLMEDKAKARHALMDTMVLAGVWEKPNCFVGAANPGEPPTCQRIISIARSSVERLCIA
ncbi:hypothetical protein F5B22DRAFT_633833 [Xylaria bambusicola]|uniref:uncharacterized protein n=1 Tax=Xylaria bambusicola TaxID=326684 RepID=UPI002008E4FA|nr:uncharacterized protein F5B22DRAFT_633833 [Xylaria bambusicola]KAI0523713.1 hypothetical protein F5B22DRAFT_633833 [Xylaria bambusicola]